MSPRVIELADLEHPQLAPYVNVRHTNTTRFGKHFIAEGRLIVQRLIASDYDVESILVERGRMPEWISRVDGSTEIYVLPREQIETLVGFDFHRGVMACGVRQAIPQADQVEWASVKRAIALIGVTESENMGSLLRSAAAFGVHHVFIGPGTADPLARRVLRVSMATALKHQYFLMPDPVAVLRQWSASRQVRTLATTLDATAVCMSQVIDDARPWLLLMGNEAEGLSPEILRVASDRVTIPMQLGTDSLNVAVAGAVFLYELSRSTWEATASRSQRSWDRHVDEP